jgi:hypothetical protein
MNMELITVTAETVETVAESGATNVLQELIANTDPMRFVDTLKYMGVGMLGIFIVMGILIVGTGLLNRILSGKNEDNE